jgi:predicted DNA-binding transcriptional regulator AlpA
MNNHLYNSKKIQEIYSISRPTLHRRLSAGQIPQPIQINGRNYWSAELIEQHLSQLTGGVES